MLDEKTKAKILAELKRIADAVEALAMRADPDFKPKGLPEREEA